MSRWTDAVAAILATSDLDEFVAQPDVPCPTCGGRIRIAPSRRRGGWFGCHLSGDCPRSWQKFPLCETPAQAHQAVLEEL